MMSNHRDCRAIMVLWETLILLCVGLSAASAHQDPCHRMHRCPSDHATYLCGDEGRCDQCPDHQCCRANKPRVAVSPTPAPVPPAPTVTQPSTSSGTTVCFTPGGNCTDHIV